MMIKLGNMKFRIEGGLRLLLNRSLVNIECSIFPTVNFHLPTISRKCSLYIIFLRKVSFAVMKPDVGAPGVKAAAFHKFDVPKKLLLLSHSR